MPSEGRPPKPTALKLLAGNPGKRPMNATEPKPRVVLPKPPAELSAGAKKEWRRLGKKLVDLGVLTEIDTAVFSVFCSAWARMLDAEANLSKYGPVLNVGGELKLSPYFKILQEANATILKSAVEFGLSASSRTRVHAEPKPKAFDPMEEMLAGNNY